MKNFTKRVGLYRHAHPSAGSFPSVSIRVHPWFSTSCFRLRLFRLGLALAALLMAVSAQAQHVVLHLRNGDRLAGMIISETTNQLTLSTVWAKELSVPLAMIERREVLPDTGTAASPNPATNAPATAAPNGSTVTAAKSSAPILPAVPTPAPAKTTPWYKKWKGDVTVGTDMVRGATDTELYYGKVNLTFSQPYARDPKEFFRNIFTFTTDYGKTDGTLSANDMRGSSKTDFDLDRRFYVYNLGAAGYDEIQKINLGYEDGPGFGYHWLTRTNLAVNLELGANYQVEDRSDDTRTESFYYRLAEDVTWKINKQMTLTEKFEFFPRADEPRMFRFRFESNLAYALMQNLSLNLT